MQPWVKDKFGKQNRRVQIRLDSLEKRHTRQLICGPTPSITEVKAEVAELRKIIVEMNERSFIPISVITEVDPGVEVENIWKVPMGEKGRKREKKRKRQRIKKENLKKNIKR